MLTFSDLRGQSGAHTPSLFEAPPVVRTFDTPEFKDVTFYEVEAKSLLNRVPAASYVPFTWTVNVYRGCSHACIFCFARPTHTYLNFDTGEDFERKIVVKVNAPEVLRRELRKPSWAGEHVAMGTNTDPYQRCEGRYRLTRGVLQVMLEYRNPCSILTKSPLLTRDLDLMVALHEQAGFSAALSVGTLDEDVWRRSEPGTPHPRARIDAVRRLREAGVPCGVLMGPVLPGISDHPEQLRAVVEAAADAGATHVSGITLHLRRGVKEEFMPWLEREYPQLVGAYRSMYRGAYAPPSVRNRISADIDAAREGTDSARWTWRETSADPQPPTPSEPEQLALY